MDPGPGTVLIQYRDPYWSNTETRTDTDTETRTDTDTTRTDLIPRPVLINTETCTDAEFSVMYKRFCF